MSDAPLLVLLLCDFHRGSAGTIVDYIEALRGHSRHDVFLFDPVGVPRPAWLDLDRFDVILTHYSVSLLRDDHLDATWREAMARSPAMKAAIMQDEYRLVDVARAALRALDVELLFTLFPPDEAPRIYPSSMLPRLQTVTVMTGCVPDWMVGLEPSAGPRPIDVGYRAGWDGYWWLGELYQEKFRIGAEFLARAQGTDLRCDIALGDRGRIYGKAWLDFLRSCRWTLGTESGASVVDFDGTIERRTREYVAAHPGASFREVQAACFAEREGDFRMNVVSPRVFEATACGAGLVMFEGEYSGVVRAGEHYITLAKDFSNFAEVVERLRDDGLLAAMVRRTREDIILSGRFSYRHLVRTIDEALAARAGDRRPSGGSPGRVARLLEAAGAAAALPVLSALPLYSDSGHLRPAIEAYVEALRRRMKRFHPLLFVDKARLIAMASLRRRRR
jgi:hypothetical protein